MQLCSRKRSFSNKEAKCFHDITDVNTSSNASLQGVVTVSPVHKGGKSANPYFDATILLLIFILLKVINGVFLYF